MAAFPYLLTNPQRLSLLQDFVAEEKVGPQDFFAHYQKAENKSRTEMPDTDEARTVDACLDRILGPCQRTMKARRSLVQTMTFLQRHSAYEYFTTTPAAMVAGGYAAHVLIE